MKRGTCERVNMEEKDYFANAAAAAYLPTPVAPSLLARFWVWWARALWWTHQTGRMLVSGALACVIYVIFAVLPGLLALPVTALLLCWLGQYDVAYARVGVGKKD